MNGYLRSHLRSVACGTALLIGTASQAAATATPAEATPPLTASALLDESLLNSDHYAIAPEVVNDGRMNRYQLNSEIQSLKVESDALLRERAHEIEAIVALRQMKESDTFQK